MGYKVIVAFDVDATDSYLAERIVEERLYQARNRLLWENDSNDVANGTCDPINTFAVVPLTLVLERSI